MQFSKLGISVAIAAAALMTGCGSSGSDDDNNGVQSYSVSGKAAKGIIINGLVSAQELVSGSWVERGTATTDSAGDYSINLNGYQGGVLQLVISADQNTDMVDDDPASATYGQVIEADQDLEMASILSSVSTGTVSNVPITPYTNMAAARVGALGLSSVTADDVDDSNSEVSVLVGFDVINTAAVDVTDADAMSNATSSQQQAAMLAAAINALTDTDTSLSEAVDALASSFEDGSFNDQDEISITELMAAWQETSDSSVIAETVDSSVTSSVEAAIDAIEAVVDQNMGSYDPEPSENAGDENVVVAKAAIADLRALVSNMSETDIETPLDLVGDDIDAAVDLFDYEMAAVAEFTELGIAAMLNDMDMNGDTYLAEVESESWDGELVVTVAVMDGETNLGDLTMTITEPSAGVKLQLSGVLTGQGDNPESVEYDNLTLSSQFAMASLLDEYFAPTSLHFDVSGAVSSSDSSFEIVSGTLAVETNEPMYDGNIYIEMIDAFALTDLEVVMSSGGDSFTGTAGIEFVAVDYDYSLFDESSMTLSSVELSGEFNMASGASLSASVELDLLNSETIDLGAILGLNSDNVGIDVSGFLTEAEMTSIATIAGVSGTSWQVYYGYDEGGTFAYKWDEAGYTSLNDSTTFTNLLSVADPLLILQDEWGVDESDEVYWTEVYVSSSGSSNFYADVEFGSEGIDENEDDFIQLSFAVSTVMTGIDGMPDISLSASIDRETYDSATGAIQLNWDGNQYSLNVDVSSFEAEAVSIVITNPDGVELTLSDLWSESDDLSGELYIGENKVADIETLDSGLVKVSYIDGTFEVL